MARGTTLTRVKYLPSQAPSALVLHCAVRTQAVSMLPEVQIELDTNLRRSISRRTQNTVTVQSYRRADHFACDRGHGPPTTMYCCIGRFHAFKSQLTQPRCGGQTITRGRYVMYWSNAGRGAVFSRATSAPMNLTYNLWCEPLIAHGIRTWAA